MRGLLRSQVGWQYVGVIYEAAASLARDRGQTGRTHELYNEALDVLDGLRAHRTPTQDELEVEKRIREQLNSFPSQ